MRALVCLVMILTVAPGSSTAHAQPNVADAIQALARSDHRTAVSILRPLVEESAEPDPLAQFFMATLYDEGLGVPRNPFRACGLYLASAKPANPLANQALVLVGDIQERVPAMRRFCTPANVRGWTDPTAAFVVSPGRSVTIERGGVTIRANGTEKYTPMPLGGPGLIYLPIRHTSLQVSRPIEARRDFIEFFVWLPSPQANDAWVLTWSVHEVVGLELIRVGGEGNLKTIVAERLPDSLDVAELARLVVGASGEAEWIVDADSPPRRGIIPFKPVQ